MAARVINIADDVVTVINGGTFTLPDTFTASRLYVPEYTLEQVKSLKVSVVPMRQPEIVYARRQSQMDFSISVGIQKKIDNFTTDFDDLVLFVDEVAALFRFIKLPTTSISWIGTENDPIFDSDHATTMNVFSSVLTFTFRDFLAT